MGVASASTTIAVAMASASDCVVTILLAAETRSSLITLNMGYITFQTYTSHITSKIAIQTSTSHEDEEVYMAGKRGV